MLIGGILITSLFLLIFLAVPVYIALGATGTLGLIFIAIGPGFGNPLIVIPQSIYTGIGFFPLLAYSIFSDVDWQNARKFSQCQHRRQHVFWWHYRIGAG